MPVRWRKWLAGEGLGDAWYQAARRLERSVLATGLLPQWREGPRRGELRNVGGLGGGRPERRLRRVWCNVNTDQMVWAWREAEEGAGSNVPTLDGRPLEPSDYRDEIVAGFAEMYGLLLRDRDGLLSAEGPLRGAAPHRVRVILRSTAAYRRLLERSLSPAACQDETARGAVLEALAGIYRGDGERPAAWPLLEAERRALEAGDVPLFRAPAGETRIELPCGGAVEGALEMSSLEAVREGLESLGPSDLQTQVSLIRAALAPSPLGATAAAPATAPLPDRGRLLEAALAIGAGLRARAVAGPDGSVAWIGPRAFAAGGLYALSVLGPDLYGGTAGIALFLAALHRATGDREARDLALRAIAPLRRRLAGDPADRELGIGGLTGLPSVLYGLLWVGELLGEPDLAREARGFASLLDPGRIAADREFDVVSGCAGAILGLLALLPPSGGEPLLELASLCAGRLLACRTSGPEGARGWAAGGRPPAAGFSHGAAGICHALLRLYALTRDPGLLEAAREGIAGERRLGSPEEGWRDPRHPGAPPRSTWCHGAPGIALARIGALDVLDEPEIRAEIRAALDATSSHPLTAIDHLCCGNLGRAEVLLHASEALADSGLHEEALSIAGRVLLRAARSGGFGCAPYAGADLTDPSFFRGDAGIGFTLLRLADPGALPCPLLLAGPAGTLCNGPGKKPGGGPGHRESGVDCGGNDGEENFHGNG